MSRNIGSSKITAVILFFLFNPHGKYLDFAGGYGFFGNFPTWKDVINISTSYNQMK